MSDRFEETLYTAELSVRPTPHLTGAARRVEALQTSQRLIRTSLAFLGTDPEGEFIDLRDEQQFALGDPAFGFGEEAFRQTRNSGRIQYDTPRTDAMLDVFDESRRTLLSAVTEKVYGFEVTLQRRLSRRNAARVVLGSRTVEFRRRDEREDDFRHMQLVLRFRLSPDVEARFEYTRSVRDSNVEEGRLKEHAASVGIRGAF